MVAPDKDGPELLEFEKLCVEEHNTCERESMA